MLLQLGDQPVLMLGPVGAGLLHIFERRREIEEITPQLLANKPTLAIVPTVDVERHRLGLTGLGSQLLIASLEGGNCLLLGITGGDDTWPVA